MNSPIETTGASGLTIYAIIHHPDGRVWDDILKVWEVYNSGHWANYAVLLAEQGAGYYRAEYPTDISGVLTTECIYYQASSAPSPSDAPSAGIGQSQGVNLVAVNNDTDSVISFLLNLSTMKRGKVVPGIHTSTQFMTDLSDATDDVYVGRLLIFTSGALIRKAGYIQASNGTSKKVTVSDMGAAPSTDDEFIII
jgi:hypothetical protein